MHHKLDYYVLSLIFANIVTVVTTLALKIDLKSILFIYLSQSIIIGFFTILKFVFYSENSSDEKWVRLLTKMFFIIFFMFHYGLFHIVYYVFITSELFGLKSVSYFSVGIFLPVLSFFIWSIMDFFRRKTITDYTMIFFRPYYRIIPMHLTIVLGGIILSLISNSVTYSIVLVFFLVLRSIADIISYKKTEVLP